MVRLRRTARKVVDRIACRITAKDLERSFQEVIRDVEVIFLHSSLSHCGYVSRGANTVIVEIGKLCDLVVMPTHTYCYPRDGRISPLFDVATSESLVGAITNAFWKMPGVVRSIHPTHSIAARGNADRELCSQHELCNTPCGEGTPYEKLIKHGASVLMFGTTMNTYTLFHTAEDAAGCPYLYEPEPYDLHARDTEGNVHTVRMYRQNMRIERRFAEIDEVLEFNGLLKRSRLGRGELLFIPNARDVHDFLLGRMRSDPFFLVSERARSTVERQCSANAKVGLDKLAREAKV